MDNANSIDYLEKIKIQVIENLKKTTFAPSVQMQDVPRDALGGMTEEEEAELDDLDDDENKDVRNTQRKLDIRRARDDEFEDSDEEGDENDYGLHKANGERKSRNIMSYQMAGNEVSDVDMDSGVQTPQVGNEVDEVTSAMVTEANAEVNAEVMEKKQQDATAAMIGEIGPSNAASRAASVKQPAALDDDGDVEMMEEPSVPVPVAAAAPTEPAAPPISPISVVGSPATASNAEPPAAPVTTEALPEVAAIVKQEGEAERNDENVKAEVSTTIAEQSQPPLE